jgi:WD40 repeat protein
VSSCVRVFRVLGFGQNYVVDLAWSRSQYLLSAGMDNFVRLWHMSTDRCLHKLQHPDCVSSVAFHPTMDRYFLSGCFDKKLRVWNLETGRVVSGHPVCGRRVVSRCLLHCSVFALYGWSAVMKRRVEAMLQGRGLCVRSGPPT